MTTESKRAHSHYFKDVTNLTVVDVYRVCDLFKVDDPSGAIPHAIKKLLLPGQRGAGKDRKKDIREAIDTLKRKLEMMEEDEIIAAATGSDNPALGAMPGWNY